MSAVQQGDPSGRQSVDAATSAESAALKDLNQRMYASGAMKPAGTVTPEAAMEVASASNLPLGGGTVVEAAEPTVEATPAKSAARK